MASALDILNSLEEPVEDILKEKNYNINTDAFNDPAEMPYMYEDNPSFNDKAASFLVDLFNKGFIDQVPSTDANFYTDAYQPMVPDERNVLQELKDISSDPQFYSMLGNTAKDVGTDVYNTALDTVEFLTGLPLSPLGAIDMIPGVDKKGIFDALQIKRDAPKLFEGYVEDQKVYDFLEELQNDPGVYKKYGSELALMIKDPETSVDEKAMALREFFEPDSLSFKDSLLQETKNVMNDIGFYESRVSEDNPYKDVADALRITGNVIPATYTTVGAFTPYATKFAKYGLAGIASTVDKLPPGMQKVAQQTFPFISGKGSFFPKRTMVKAPYSGNQVPKGNVFNRDWNKIMTQPTSIRNFIYGGLGYGAQSAMENSGNMFSANAAEIVNNPKYDPTFGDSDPVIFDSYMQDKIANFKPRPKAPGPRNNYQGM